MLGIPRLYYDRTPATLTYYICTVLFFVSMFLYRRLRKKGHNRSGIFDTLFWLLKIVFSSTLFFKFISPFATGIYMIISNIAIIYLYQYWTSVLILFLAMFTILIPFSQLAPFHDVICGIPCSIFLVWYLMYIFSLNLHFDDYFLDFIPLSHLSRSDFVLFSFFLFFHRLACDDYTVEVIEEKSTENGPSVAEQFFLSIFEILILFCQ